MSSERFLEKIVQRPDEELKLREQGWEFFMAVSLLSDYISDEKGIRYEKRDKPKTDKEILQNLGEEEFKIGTAYKLTRKIEEGKYKFGWQKNPSAGWVYKKR